MQAKTAQTDGYEAVQLGLVEETPAKVGKPLAGHYKKANVPPTRVRREVKLAAGRRGAEGRRPGAGRRSSPTASAWTSIGTSRGKGFQGVVKRHHFAGGAATHGSMFHRAPGSIGASSFPSRVVKGMRAAGRMGGGRVTMHNLKVLRVDAGQPPADRRGRHSRRADRLRGRSARRSTAKKIKVAQVEKPKKGKK